MRTVEWHPLAMEDLHEAAATYKAQRVGRDERFLAGVSATVELLQRFSHLGRSVDEADRRGLLVHRFPYSVIYRVRAESIQIVAIAHHKRDHGFWHGR